MKIVQFRRQALVAAALIAFAVVSRMAPHPANVAPIAAVALFAGMLLPRKLAIIVPVLSMVFSDMFIGLHNTIFYTWGSFLLIALLSSYVLKSVTVRTVVLGSLGASLLFFVVSNFGVWVEARMYAHTLEGFLQCYYNALPFFRNTLLGDVAYSGMLYGAYAFYQVAQQQSIKETQAPSVS